MPNNVFPYPGNKARHSDWILEHIPEHECYVELFGGAAGVLFNKPRSKIEVYNDLNGDIPHFFRVLRDRGDELQEWLKNVPYSEELHSDWGKEYYNGKRPKDDIERAGKFFYLRYTQFGSKIEGISGFKSGFGQRNHANQFVSKVSALHEFRERLSGVEISEQSAFDAIDRFDSPTTVFYADPPYEGSEHIYNGQGFKHAKLAEKAKEIDGKIAISYGTIPHFYNEKFTVVSKDSNFNCDNRGGTKDATEYLIMNYDSGGEKIMSDVGQQTLSEIVD